MFWSLLLFVGDCRRVNRLISWVMVVFDCLIFMVLIKIILKFVVLIIKSVLCVCCVMLFRVLLVGDGWINVLGLWESFFICVLLFRMDLFEWEDEGLIVNIVSFRFWWINCMLKVLINVDFFILGVLDRLIWIVFFVCGSNLFSNVLVCFFWLIWDDLMSVIVFVSVWWFFVMICLIRLLMVIEDDFCVLWGCYLWLY